MLSPLNFLLQFVYKLEIRLDLLWNSNIFTQQ